MKTDQSLAGYIRQHLDVIEARLEVGIRQDVIIRELTEIGYTTTLQSFRNLLYRARKWKQKQVTKETHKSVIKSVIIEENEQNKLQQNEVSKSPQSKPTSFQYGNTKPDESELI